MPAERAKNAECTVAWRQTRMLGADQLLGYAMRRATQAAPVKSCSAAQCRSHSNASSCVKRSASCAKEKDVWVGGWVVVGGVRWGGVGWGGRLARWQHKSDNEPVSVPIARSQHIPPCPV